MKTESGDTKVLMYESHVKRHFTERKARRRNTVTKVIQYVILNVGFWDIVKNNNESLETRMFYVEPKR